jgi:16S rRNA (guanine527-N7)-methyltransferase
MELAQLLTRGIEKLELNVSGEKQLKLMKYLALLKKWNNVYNLTAIRNQQQMVTHHLLDSLSILPNLRSGNCLDVGCGAGIPGIILAIAKPEGDFTLIDSNGKKTSFVRQAVIELDIKNVEIITERVETWETQDKFKYIISRAFANTSEFVTLTRRLIAKNGQWLAMKGEAGEELDNLPVGIEIENLISLQVPEINASRSLVILKERNG